jgi:hypothetical protein
MCTKRASNPKPGAEVCNKARRGYSVCPGEVAVRPEVPIGWCVSLGRVTMNGYRDVDVAQSDGTYPRYRLASQDKPGPGVRIEVIPAKEAARYAVSHARNGTPQDREHWVASATVTVSDTQTGEVLCELTAFSFAPQLDLGRLARPIRTSLAPWLACLPDKWRSPSGSAIGKLAHPDNRIRSGGTAIARSAA